MASPFGNANALTETICQKATRNFVQADTRVTSIQPCEVIIGQSNFNDGKALIAMQDWATDNIWRNWSELYLDVPLEIRATVDVTAAGQAGVMRVGWKPFGVLGLVHQIQITVGNRNVSENSHMQGLYAYLRLLMTWSNQTLEQIGQELFIGNPRIDILNKRFAPNTGTTFTTFRSNDVYDGNASASTYLTYTITNPEPTTFTIPSSTMNLSTGSETWSITNMTTTLSGTSGLNTNVTTRGDGSAYVNVNTRLYFSSLAMAYPDVSGGNNQTYARGAGANYATINSTTSITYNVNAQLPLKYVHDFFNEVGIVRNQSLIITLYLNQINTGQTTTVAATTGLSTGANWQNGFSPIIVANSTTMPTNVQMRIGSIDSPGSKNIRVFVPKITFSPQFELSMRNIQRTIRWYDHVMSVLPNQPAQGQLTLSFGQTIVNPRALIMLGFPAASILQIGGSSIQNGWAMQSSSYEPALSSQGFKLDNIYIKYSAINLNEISYDSSYRYFREQVSTIYGLNAGANPQLSSGVYDNYMFENAPIYMFDTSYYCQGNQPASLTCTATNVSLFDCDILSFMVFQKQVTFGSKDNGESMISDVVIV